MIPGSSLKGLIAHYAHQYYGPDWLNPDSEGIRQGHKIGKYAELLFGSADNAGYVQFLDAMWKPTDDRPLSKDVISVHQTKYYRENTLPTDTDSPTVVTFLAVRKNQSFILPLIGSAEWIDIVVTLLTDALKNHGIGAKTNAGYGRMKVEAFVDSNQQVVEAFVDPNQQVIDAFVKTHKLDTLANATNKNVIIDQAFRAFVREQKSMHIKVQILVARMLRDAMKANGRDSSLAYQDMRKLADRDL
jgi:CRISPR type III-B/RAMP module RAMP protein Cmr6